MFTAVIQMTTTTTTRVAKRMTRTRRSWFE